MEGNIPGRPAEGHGKIFGQNIFTGRFSTGKKQVFAAEQRSDGLLPDFPAVIEVARHGNTGAQCPIQRMGGLVPCQFLHQRRINLFLPQKIQDFCHGVTPRFSYPLNHSTAL